MEKILEFDENICIYVQVYIAYIYIYIYILKNKFKHIQSVTEKLPMNQFSSTRKILQLYS